MKNTQKLLLVLATLSLTLQSFTLLAAEIRKANSGDPLDQGSSWIGGIAPTNTDVALWDGDSGTGIASPSTNLSWSGIRVLDMNQFTGGSVQFPLWIQTLALGDAGIDLSASQHDMEFYSGFVSLETNQVWHVGPGRVLTLDSENGGGTGGLWKVGPGVLRLAYDFSPSSHLNDAAPVGLAGGVVRLDGAYTHTEVVGSTFVYGDSTRLERWGSGGSTLVLSNITRYVGGTVDFMQPGIALTSTGNDASAGDGILGGWATVNFGQDWAQVAAGGGNQSIDAYPMGNYSTDFEETNNVSLSSSVTLTNTTSFAINSLRFGSDAVLTLGSTTNMYSLTNLSGGILMSGGAIQAAIVSSSLGRTLRGPAGGDLIFHVPHPFQTLSNQVLIADNATCGLTKCGNGTLLLNQVTHNSYAGLTTINGGTLRTGNVTGRRYVSSMMMINPNGTYLHGTGENNLNLTGITVNGGTLNLNGRNDSCYGLLLANNGFITGFAPGKTFTAGSSTNPFSARWGTIDVALNAPGGLVKTTDRKLVILQNSTITGDTRVENGTMQVISNATVTAGNLVLGTMTNTARLILGGTNGFGGDMSGSISITNLTVASTNLMPGFGFIVGGSSALGWQDSALIFNAVADTSFDVGALGGFGPNENNLGLTKSGPGTLTLTGFGNYNGFTSNSVGVLKIGNTNAIPSGNWPAPKGMLSLSSGTSLDLDGSDAWIGGLYGSGVVTSSGGFATLNFRGAGSGDFAGTINNGVAGVAVTQHGSGRQLFRGTNTYVGTTTIFWPGSIGVDADAILGNGSGNIDLEGGTLDITESRTVPVSNPITVSGFGYIGTSASYGSVVVEITGQISGGSTETLVFTNMSQGFGDGSFFGVALSRPQTFNMPIVIQDSTYPYVGVTGLYSANPTGTTQTFNGPIYGRGSFTSASDGVVIINATNRNWSTFVNGGLLILNGAIEPYMPNWGGYMYVQGGGTLAGNGRIGIELNVTHGGTLSPGKSIGKLTVNNSLTFALYGTPSTCFMELGKNGSSLTNDSIVGITTLTYGGTLSLTNLGPTPLAAGDSFKLFTATNYIGTFTNISPVTPGPGLVWDTSSLTTNGTLKVAALPASPLMEQTMLVGTNFIVSGSGGVTNGTYYVLTSTNAALPVTNWTLLTTNTFDGNGNFTFTNAVSLSTPQRFFLLQLP